MTNDRHALGELAKESGWQRRALDRIDIYKKGIRGVEVIFTDAKLIGATLFEDLHLLTHSRDIPTVQSWLTR
jgi:hypothetical protein